jgi:hypothetical protein
MVVKMVALAATAASGSHAIPWSMVIGERIIVDSLAPSVFMATRRQTSVNKAAAQFCRCGRKNISSFLYDAEELCVLFDHVEKQLRHRDAAVERQELQPFAYLKGHSEIECDEPRRRIAGRSLEYHPA